MFRSLIHFYLISEHDLWLDLVTLLYGYLIVPAQFVENDYPLPHYLGSSVRNELTMYIWLFLDSLLLYSFTMNSELRQ